MDIKAELNGTDESGLCQTWILHEENQCFLFTFLYNELRISDKNRSSNDTLKLTKCVCGQKRKSAWTNLEIKYIINRYPSPRRYSMIPNDGIQSLKGNTAAEYKFFHNSLQGSKSCICYRTKGLQI